MGDEGRAPPRGNPGGNVLGAMGAMFGALFCFIGCAVAGPDLGRPHKAPTVVLAGISIAFGVASIVLIRLAVHLEHQFRTSGPAHHPVRAAGADPGATAPKGRHPKNGPVARGVAILACVGVVAFVVLLSVHLHADAARSTYTQHHGIARAGTVATVTSVEHTTRYDSWHTYDYDVDLSAPVGTTRRTVVHDPTKDDTDFIVGDPIPKVLVDPREPTYAELPGRGAGTSDWYAFPLVMGGCFLVVGVALAAEEIKHRRHQRAGSPADAAPRAA